VRSNGHLRKHRLLSSRWWKTSLKSMVPGSGPRHLDEPRGGSGLMLLPVPGGWKTALSGRSKPVVERACVKRMSLPNGPSIWPTRPIGSRVLYVNTVWHQEPKEIALGVSAPSAVSCLPLLRCLLNENRSSSDRSAGWMWQVERFAAPG
jgi:hypothetical protein